MPMEGRQKTHGLRCDQSECEPILALDITHLIPTSLNQDRRLPIFGWHLRRSWPLHSNLKAIDLVNRCRVVKCSYAVCQATTHHSKTNPAHRQRLSIWMCGISPRRTSGLLWCSNLQASQHYSSEIKLWSDLPFCVT